MSITHLLENTTYDNFIDFYNEINSQEMRIESDKIFLIKGCRFKEVIDFRRLLHDKSVKHIFFNEECIFEKDIEYVNMQDKIQATTLFTFERCIFYGKFQFSGYILNDLTLISCVLKRECTIGCDINGPLRLFGTIFEKELNFSNAVLKKIILFTGDTDHSIFRGDLSFFNSEIYDARFWNNTFEKKVVITNTKFHCSVYFTNSTFKNDLIIQEIDTLGKMEFKHPLYLDNSKIHGLYFSKIIFENYVTLNNADVDKVKFDNILFSRYPLSISSANVSIVEDEYLSLIHI